VLAEAGATVHLAHPLGVKGFAYRRVKNDERDAADLADLLRMGRLPEAWVAPPEVRGLREAVRHRAKLVAMRSGLKAQVHAVLAKQRVQVCLGAATIGPAVAGTPVGSERVGPPRFRDHPAVAEPDRFGSLGRAVMMPEQTEHLAARAFEQGVIDHDGDRRFR
jgi:hypothetical protein